MERANFMICPLFKAQFVCQFAVINDDGRRQQFFGGDWFLAFVALDVFDFHPALLVD